MVQITGGAHSWIVNFLHAMGATLSDNLGGEIDLVMWRANAGLS